MRLAALTLSLCLAPLSVSGAAATEAGPSPAKAAPQAAAPASSAAPPPASPASSGPASPTAPASPAKSDASAARPSGTPGAPPFDFDAAEATPGIDGSSSVGVGVMGATDDPGAPPEDPTESGATSGPASRPRRASAPRAASAAATRRYVIQPGDNLGSIALRHHVPLRELLRANRLLPTSTIRVGHSLIIPLPGSGHASPGDAPGAGRRVPPATDMQTLEVAHVGKVHYFEPTGPGRLSMRPVFVYLHGRGARPDVYCRRWARVTRSFGWLACPEGPEDRGEGRRGWKNSWPAGQRAALAAVEALRGKFGRRVQLYGNTLMGFSEGAYVAMNAGLRATRTFNRWLILGADTDYWGPVGLAELEKHRGRLRRVYLITGAHDETYEAARQVRRWLEQAGAAVRVATPEDMGHEVQLEDKRDMYSAALAWLARG